MKKLILISLILGIVITGCKKNDNTAEPKDKILSDNTIVVTNDVVNSSLVAVDSSNITFSSTGTGVDKIKVGTILVSDMTSLAPIGYLRKVIGVSTVGGNKVFTTEQASLTDAIINANTTFSKPLTDSDIIGEDSSGIDISAQQRVGSLSFTFNYNKVIYDADGNTSTTNDQLRVFGEMKIEPTFDFELDISGGNVRKFLAKINLKNTNKINADSKVILANLNREIVLKTFQLKPFTIFIAGVPVPIAKQWIAIVLGLDGSLTARVTAGVQNINNAVAGVAYENNSWNTINTQDNSFSLQALTFEGNAKVEPWLQTRYEIRPYGVRDSRIYIGVRGSVIGEASIIPTGLSTTLKWGVKFSAKAQMQILDRAVLNYEQIFFEREFLISQSNTTAFPTLTTTSISNVTQTTAQSGGTINSDGGAAITIRGVCWSTSPTPTTSNNVSSSGSGIGTFTSTLTGLTANTTYYVRAYATNSAGTGYGDEVSFVTNPSTAGVPSLTTLIASSVTTNSAQSGGMVISDGGQPVISRGVCWGTSPNPTILSNTTSNGTGTGNFTSTLSGLNSNTLYYARAYATNSLGTGYGNQTSFTTASGSVTDIDGNVYPTITIGSQVWMAENLKVSKYRNGDLIPTGLSNASWQAATTGAYAIFNNNASNNTVYGKLYNWYAVTDNRNVCPNGWHVPSDAEIDALVAFLGGNSIAGGKIKEIGTSHWASPNTGATNSSGFTGLPGGYRHIGGTFVNLRYDGIWWSSSQSVVGLAGILTAEYNLNSVRTDSTDKRFGFSVRCVKD